MAEETDDTDEQFKTTPTTMTPEQYYTPELEDLHVGYECELRTDINENTWVAHKLSHIGGCDKFIIYSAFIMVSSIRTPYLTPAQIEAEGWIYKGGSSYRKGDYLLKYLGGSSYSILDISLPIDEYVFLGRIPSINEFRKICKLLEIK